MFLRDSFVNISAVVDEAEEVICRIVRLKICQDCRNIQHSVCLRDRHDEVIYLFNVTLGLMRD